MGTWGGIGMDGDLWGWGEMGRDGRDGRGEREEREVDSIWCVVRGVCDEFGSLTVAFS